ncbi:MAG: CHRD domain-containing protein [Ktedonobacteraceae bacterium]
MPTFKRKSIRFIASGFIAVAAILILLAGSSQPAGAKELQKAQAAFTIVQHTPHGSVDLRWNEDTKDLTVTIKLTGLAANSTHPAHIHAGDCSVNGAILFPLNNVVADAAGATRSTTVLHNMQQGIPNSGWYINVHNGPTLGSADEAAPITCGNVHAPTKNEDGQRSFADLGTSIAPNQHSFGAAILFIQNGTLTVFVVANGLVPGSAHAAHIHLGSCERQVPGNVIHPLMSLVADQDGNAVSTTVIPNVTSIPDSGWYVNIHRSTDLSTQTGFDPILCGNVRE